MSTLAVVAAAVGGGDTAVSLPETGGGGVDAGWGGGGLLEESQRKLAAITAVEGLAVVLLALYLLRRFASRAVPWWVLVFVFLGWVLGFSGALLLPLDLAFAKSNEMFSSRALVQYWEGLFWASAVAANVLFPLLKGVVSSGAFTCGGKLRDSLRKSLIFYVVVAAIAGATLAWVWLTGLTPGAVLGFAMALSNIYGLLLIIVLMSFGFVDVPRYFWLLGDYPRLLRRLQLQAVALEHDAYEADLALVNACNHVADAVAQVRRRAQSGGASHAMSDLASQLEVRAAVHVPEDVTLRASEVEESPFAMPDANDDKRLRRGLEQLHGRLLGAQMRCHQAHARWDSLVRRAARLSELVSRRNGFDEASHKPRLNCSARAALFCGVHVAPWGYKLLAVLAGLLSAVLVWSELTIAVPYALSPLGYVISALEERGDAALLQVAALVPLLYMTFATYRSLVQLRMPFVDAQHMYDGRQTGSYALLFNATYVCTLQFTLGFNYLALLQLGEWSDSGFAVPDCAFTNVTGSMDVLPVLGSSFFVFFPVVTAVLVAAFAFRVHARLLRLCGASLDPAVDPAADVSNAAAGDDTALAEGISLIQERKVALEKAAASNNSRPLGRGGHV